MIVQLSRLAHFPAPLRLGIFLIILLFLWLPFAIPLYYWLKSDPNQLTIVAMGLLYIFFLGLLKIWSLWVYQNSRGLQVYGWVWSRKSGREFLKGLSLGLGFVLTLFITEALFGWIRLQSSSALLIRIIAEGLLSAVAIALAEELFFRGWILTELKRDYSLKTSIWISGIIFASLHFIKPLPEVIRTFPQFPALVLLGVILACARHNHGQRLGICIGLHGGLVWGYYIFNVGDLVRYTDQISPLITGIDRNPLAGLMGIIFLLILSNLFRIKS